MPVVPVPPNGSNTIACFGAYILSNCTHKSELYVALLSYVAPSLLGASTKLYNTL